MVGVGSLITRSALILTMALSATVRAQAPSIAEQYLFSALNQERIAHHLQPLHLDSALQRAALLHAQRMADHEGISHKFSDEPDLSSRASDAGAHFDLVTENVAEGPTAVVLHDAWMHSPGHRANILDPAVDAVGIAVVARAGQLYAVQDFDRSIEDLTLDQQEAAVGVMLDRAGVDLIPGEDARRTCSMTTGYAGAEQPDFVVRFTSADLTQLPTRLKARLSSGVERRASVGACAAHQAGPFTAYTIAVLLYR